ncbi:MAG: RidA family protein [Robiginitomaculum sp.]|nr:RidA family protein [Robiginitomaculum sp.]
MSKQEPKRKLISSGSEFEEKFGYSRAVVAGDWCFVSGTTGYDYGTMKMPESAAQQASNAFQTIKTALEAGGFELGQVVRVQYTITDAKYAGEVTKILGTYMGKIRPAATMVVAGLIKSEMKIEIEVTAFKG